MRTLLDSPEHPPAWASVLTPAQVTEICDLAKAAWDQASSRARRVSFRWHEKRLISELTSFRMIVGTPDYKPVCCRWD